MREQNQRRIIVEIVLCIYLGCFGTPLLMMSYMWAGRNTIFQDSYINKIDTKYYGDNITLWCLESFDRLAPGTAVSFDEKENSRPINISITDKFWMPGTLGMALTMPHTCSIYIKKALDYKSYCDILIHEYLHCMGYSHTSNKLDIMYPYYIFDASVDNKRDYATELGLLREKWKNLKNSNLNTTPTN